ncbi:ParM/StbA family protein [Clostridium botulinum]|nr:hypothetical protein KU41_17215 [Clostridium botulinum]MBY6804308.1 ParM/StbA family protein [Clostridium botulinum]MBY6813271.1 ParM/StbA family protein [Clostridium botulinum]MBY6821552.1 ParM/StbA family protein [Clostridium botulinum]NFJ49886.1 ParM/StbA family protein [Clostridium botulinum]
MKNYSILGVDVGNSTCKTNTGVLFNSKITEVEPFGKTDTLFIDKKYYWLGEGEYDTTYRKVDKINYINFLFGALALSTNTVRNYVVLGLPLSQYKEDKSALINMVLSNKEKYTKINGVEKHLIIDDIEVFPEGVVTLDDEYEGIVVDIGGRTTDCALVINERGRRRILNPISLPCGTINLYTDFIKKLNNKFSLDLVMNDAERIIKNGLILDGRNTNIDFAMDVYRAFTENLITQLQVEYSLRTNSIYLTGGGVISLYKTIKERLGNGVSLQANSIYANTKAYYELGCSIWQ